MTSTMRVLHVVPFDPSDLPPLINTTHVSAAGGVESTIVASAPVRDPQVFAATRFVQPERTSGGFSQLRFMIERAREAAARERPSLVVGHNVRGLFAAALAAPIGTPVVYHCHDFQGGPGFRGRALLAGEWLAARRVAECWAPASERLDIARDRALDRRVVLVRNCLRILPELPPKGRLRAWLAAQGAEEASRGRIIQRHGMIGASHYILETLEALALLPADVSLVLIGSGGDADYVRACRAAAERLGLARRFFIHPRVPHAELWGLVIDADASMCVYVPTDLNTSTPAPNKVFESMALGVPVVVAEGNSVADDVRRAGAGLAVPLGSREALADALRTLVDDGPVAAACRRAARQAHLDELNCEAQLLPTMLGALLRPGPAARSLDREPRTTARLGVEPS